MRHVALLALEDGSLFWGESIGANGTTTGEVVFNTALTGYQEILTDPSYARQMVTLTYPHIGNVGVNREDEESAQIHVAGLIIRELPLLASNWRSEESLESYLQRHNIVAIADIDTRRLTRILREKGSLRGTVVTAPTRVELDSDMAVQRAKECPELKGMDLAKEVTTTTSYQWNEGSWSLENGHQQIDNLPYHVVAYDFGVKRNILRMLVDRGCKLTVVPAQTLASEVMGLKPDGIFLSNGPGDPEPCNYAISAIKELTGTGLPIFGICLGHQLLSIASGAKTVKMKFGHHGANHPVQDTDSREVMITSQNHGFAVDDTTLPDNLRATHRSLFDHSLQGVHRTDCPAFGFQGHPEASPGPHDVAPLFDHFIELIEASK